MKIENRKVICRVCGSSDLERIHDFGNLPVADKLIQSEGMDIPSSPLSISFCTSCYLLQINEDLDPEVLFRNDYPYFSSKIPEVNAHFRSFYEDIVNNFKLKSADVIIEIAGNDGVLLQNFQNEIEFLINIEPSMGPAEEAKQKGLHTIESFFSFQVAKHLRNDLPSLPRFIFAANVLAHVPNPSDFVKGLSYISDEKTTIVVEVPHALPMLEDTLFDVIFHQHFSYFSLLALSALFQTHGLFINEVKKVKTQGGSLRLFISKNPNLTQQSVHDLLAEESKKGLKNLSTYNEFSKRISDLKGKTMTKLGKFKKEGKRIVGYGAPGKAATLLNYFGIDKTYLDYLVDLSPSKQGRIFPFTGLKIYPVEKIVKDKPEVVLILAWNYKESILQYLKPLLPPRTKFLTIF